jgi:hypothetical protein
MEWPLKGGIAFRVTFPIQYDIELLINHISLVALEVATIFPPNMIAEASAPTVVKPKSVLGYGQFVLLQFVKLNDVTSNKVRLLGQVTGEGGHADIPKCNI